MNQRTSLNGQPLRADEVFTTQHMKIIVYIIVTLPCPPQHVAVQ
jgi:hypothetical protein